MDLEAAYVLDEREHGIVLTGGPQHVGILNTLVYTQISPGHI